MLAARAGINPDYIISIDHRIAVIRRAGSDLFCLSGAEAVEEDLKDALVPLRPDHIFAADIRTAVVEIAIGYALLLIGSGV